MIIIKRSKINAIIEVRRLRNLRDMHPEMNKSAGWLLEHADKLIEARRHLIINDAFTSADYQDAKEYVDLLTSEDYENLSRFYIEEDI